MTTALSADPSRARRCKAKDGRRVQRVDRMGARGRLVERRGFRLRDRTAANVNYAVSAMAELLERLDDRECANASSDIHGNSHHHVSRAAITARTISHHRRLAALMPLGGVARACQCRI